MPQTLHSVEPNEDAAYPAGHAKHVAPSSLVLQLPGGQPEQFVAPTDTECSQSLHKSDSGKGANLPAGQMEQPSLFWPQDEPVAQPAGHFKHSSATLSANC